MLQIIIKILASLFLLLLTLILASIAFLYLAPQFGASPSGQSAAKIKLSKHQQNDRFVNLVDTKISTRQPGESMDFKTYLSPPPGKNPQRPLPTAKFDPTQFSSGEFVWFGHSTVLFRSAGLNILTDPVFNRASPVPIGGKPFAMQSAPSIDDLPTIDVVIISHDHYDHLDHIVMSQLADSAELFLVPLGVKAHLDRWGVPAHKVFELDWYESYALPTATFTFTPARHFSGRGVSNRNTTLWGSWVVATTDMSVFYAGDSGYFKEFERIGEQYGPFDIAFMENGAYDANWSQIHMMPEESVQAAIALKAKLFFPIHWGKFDLAKHPWNEPIQRAVVAAKQQQMPIVAPLIGQVFTLDRPVFEVWWE